MFYISFLKRARIGDTIQHEPGPLSRASKARHLFLHSDNRKPYAHFPTNTVRIDLLERGDNSDAN